jgi:hypothetical protein
VLRDLPEMELLLDLHRTQGGGEVAAPSVQVVHDGMENVWVSEEVKHYLQYDNLKRFKYQSCKQYIYCSL